jgi:hypothetical protein
MLSARELVARTLNQRIKPLPIGAAIAARQQRATNCHSD